MNRRVVFLDKDGTLVENVPYNVDPARIELAPGAGEALRLLADAGFEFVVISNQSGVARGYFDESALGCVEQRLAELLRQEGVRMLAFYWCPHHPEGSVARYCRDCDCRKPEPGLILEAARDLEIDLTRSWLVGDILNDVQAGNRAGVGTVLLLNGGETEWLVTPERRPNHMARNLRAAAGYIVERNCGVDRRDVA